MRPVPTQIIETFINAYSQSQSAIIPFGGGEESSDGTLFRLLEGNQSRLLKILFLGKDDARRALLRFEARLNLVNFLYRRGVRVIEPIPSLNDRLYELVEDQSGTWVAYAMAKSPGKAMSPKVWDPNFVQHWGGTIGKLHRITQDYPEWEHCLDPQTGEPYLTWESEWESFHHLCKETEVSEQWEMIKEELDSLPINRNCFGFIHNDPHFWNLLVDGNQVTLIDFDVANHHWFLNDIAIACQHVLFMISGGLSQPIHHRDRLTAFLKAFLKGYDRENDLDRAWLNHLDLFFAYRRILLYTVMEGWRTSKHDLQRSWKEMIIKRPPVLGAVDFLD